MASLVLISINSPLIAGLYENNTLIKHYEIQGHTSAALNSLFGDIFASHIIIDSIFYAKGPGRYSALKSTHIFLHTLSVIKGYALFSTQSFYFNDNAPIHAFGENYFMQENGKIVLKSASDSNVSFAQNGFCLPAVLNPQDFDRQNEPLYILPPV
ncbi:tRNA threonylcarbamoyladenosine biosynthesis protein TsaB [Helicobacter sp. 23-1046]